MNGGRRDPDRTILFAVVCVLVLLIGVVSQCQYIRQRGSNPSGQVESTSGV